MTSLSVHPARPEDTQRSVANERIGKTFRILAVVDGSENTGRVVEYLLVSRSRSAVPIEVVLLNIQPQPQDWRLRGYGWFHRDEIRSRLINDLGMPVVKSSGRQLDAVGIAHKERIEIGERVETIIRCAREEDCHLVVMAESTLSPFRRWLMRVAGISIGSVASAIIHLGQIPVLVAK